MASTIEERETLETAVHQSDIVQFVDEDNFVAPTNQPVRQSFRVPGLVEDRDHSIVSVLSRPVAASTGSWNSGQNAGTFLDQLILLEDYFAAHPNALSKLAGFGFMRAECDLEVQVNSVPTSFGMLVLAILPQDRD